MLLCGSPAAHNNFGAALKASGEINRAIQHFQTALELDPGYARGYNNLGSAYQMLGGADNLQAAAVNHPLLANTRPERAAKIFSGLSMGTLGTFGSVDDVARYVD